MSTYKSNVNSKGDPSHIAQSFPKCHIQVLCCRYWWLNEWESLHEALPFWRIYHNTNYGGYIIYNNKTIELSPDRIYLIAPETDYATYLNEHSIPNEGKKVSGGSLALMSDDQRKDVFKKGGVGHSFIHFTISYPFIQYAKGIYEFAFEGYLKKKYQQIFDYLKKDNTSFDLIIAMNIHSMIDGMLGDLDMAGWEQPQTDSRITKALNYISEHLTEPMTNEQLAQQACVTTNYLAHLFKVETGETAQSYIRKKRIEKSCSLLLFTQKSIAEIAQQTGFSNRYHFSRIFTEITKTTPAKYRKDNIALNE